MILAANGAAPAVRYLGGIVVVRCAEFLAGARGTLTVADPDAQATSGKSVRDEQTAASLAAAADTLSIPFSALPLDFGRDYIVQVFYRCTGSGEDDGEQHFTERRLFAWGFTGAGPALLTRADDGSPSAAYKRTRLSIARPWFGLQDLHVLGTGTGAFGYAVEVDPTEALNVAAFKTAGAGAIVIDQVVMLPAQDAFTSAARVYNDIGGAGYLGWGGGLHPFPDHVTMAHDETDGHGGLSTASYAKGADASSAEPIAADPAGFNSDFVPDATYDLYALARVALLSGALLFEDDFGRCVYRGWGTASDGEAYVALRGLDSSYVGPEGSTYDPQGAWGSEQNYEIGDLVEGSDGNGYVSTAHPNVNHDPVTDATRWAPLAGCDTGIVGGSPGGATEADAGGWHSISHAYGDLVVSARASSSILYAYEGTIASGVHLKWWPWGLAVRGGGDQYWLLAEIDTDGTLSVVLRRRDFSVAGGMVTIGGPVELASPYVPGDYYRIKLQAVGTELKGKMWADGDTEPDWQIEVLDQGLDVPARGGFEYVYGYPGFVSNVGYGRTGGDVQDHQIRWKEPRVERRGTAAGVGYVAAALTNTTDLVLGAEEIPGNRNWAWHLVGAVPRPDPQAVDVVAWSPDTADYWQAVLGQALYWVLHAARPTLDFSFRAERT